MTDQSAARERAASKYAKDKWKNGRSWDKPVRYSYDDFLAGYAEGAKSRDGDIALVIENLKAEEAECEDWRLEYENLCKFATDFENQRDRWKETAERAVEALRFYSECGEVWLSLKHDEDGDTEGAVVRFQEEAVKAIQEVAREALRAIEERGKA